MYAAKCPEIHPRLAKVKTDVKRAIKRMVQRDFSCVIVAADIGLAESEGTRSRSGRGIPGRRDMS